MNQSFNKTLLNVVEHFQSGMTSSESHVSYNQIHPEEIMRVHRTLDNLGGGYLLKRAMTHCSS